MNLLSETIKCIESNGKSINDVEFISNGESSLTWPEFELMSNFEYDNGYGGHEIDINLFIVGDDWWLERHEYDGSEWWEFKKIPERPISNEKIKNLKSGY